MNEKIKRAVAFMMVFLILLGNLPSFRGFFVRAAGSDVIRNDETGIPDKTLYQMILKELGKKPDSTFTEEEAQKVYRLSQDIYTPDDLDRKEEEKIVSLQGIEKLTNLRVFLPGRNNITDLKTLESLKNLSSLGLRYSTCITSIEGLRNLTQLESLQLPDTVTDLSPIEGMTKLSSLSVMDANISTLPDLTKHTELIGHHTYLQGNNLTKAELTSKLPKQLVEDKTWLKQTIDLQKYNVKKILKVTSPKKVTKITSKTKKIVGKADKTLQVELYYFSRKGRKRIKKVKANKNGVFKMKNLNLKKYKKKKLTLRSYYINNYYYEEWEMKAYTFKLKK
jgi:Leucine-rich repeat (LRR) protein